MKRAALYVRVSTQEQKKHGMSVDSQIVALEEYCNNNNMQIAGLYNDAGISARKTYKKRPALLQLMKDCEAGKIDIILFTKLDRWFRSVADYYDVQRVLDSAKVPWRAIWEDYDTETSSGVFKVNIMLSIAQAEADRTSERIKSVFDYKRAKGDHIGCVPFGYMRINGKIYKDESTSNIVDIIFKTYKDTHSSGECQKAAKRAGRSLSRSCVYKILYSGLYCGDVHGCECEPYITKTEYFNILNAREQYVRKNDATRKRTHIFSGLCKCGYCDYRMRTGVTKNKYGEFKNYLCICEHVGCNHNFNFAVSEKKIEKFLLENIEHLLCDYNIRAEVERTDYTDNTEEIKKLKAKLSRIGIRFEEGDISTDEYRSKKQVIEKEILSLEQSMSERPEPISLPQNWEDIYMELDDEHKRMFWNNIISEIKVYRLNDHEPVVTFI